MSKLQQIRDSKYYERVYFVTVAIKGFDGLVELLAGITLMVAPHFLHNVLADLFGKASVHKGHFMQFIAENIAHIDAELSRGGLLIVIIFLVSHGVIKLALVYALLKEILWAYPYALFALVLFLVYQLYIFIIHPTIGMGLFTLLDALIIWIVWGEWQKLKSEVHARKSKHKKAAPTDRA